MRRLALAFLALVACLTPASAGFVISIHHGAPSPASPPVNTLIPQIVGLDYPNNGTSTALSGTATTLTVDVGQWDFALSYTCKWHTVNAPSTPLSSSCSTFTIDTAATPALVGQAIELDVVASNLSGSTTQTSHWFGPIETSAPVAQVRYETLGTVGPSSLPTAAEYAHFLQNGHAIVPGCDIPPAAPNLDPAHVWVFDPINGNTQAAGATGHKGSAFKDVSALFNGGSGYVGVLFGHGNTIPPGDTILIEPGDATHPVGQLATGAPMYSTADGTATGATVFTWIMGDPAAASTPVLPIVHNQNGAIGFLFKNLRIEPAAAGTNSATIGSVGSSVAAPSHNMIYEDIRVSSWIGHSDDPWYPSAYPTTGGQSDGTVVTASPAIPQAGSQDPTVLTVTMAAGATSFASTANDTFLVGQYVWSPGYYRSAADSIYAASNGIPNGTKVVSVTSTTVQLGPCDPVADAATGCPTTNYPGLSSNIPGCDPQVTVNGVTFGGCGGSPVAWNGATRALNSERLSFTPNMVVLPAGYFNNGDWGTALSDAFSFGGALDVADSKDPSNPNLFVGSDCISVKDSIVRDVRNAFAFLSTHDSMAYNIKGKWFSGDMFDLYSTNRVEVVHSYGSDMTQIWDHQDFAQLGDSNGYVAINYLYGNAVLENEFFQSTDPTNPFPRSAQGINNTENNHWGDYVVDNTVVATTGGNGIQILGRYNVVAHNDMFGGRINVGHQTKGAALPSPIGSMLANNIGNGVTRDFSVANFCDPATGDLDVVETNLSIPFIPLAGASEAYCDLSSPPVGYSGAWPGFFQGVASWTQTDWQSQDAGVSPLFTAYHPLDPPVAPAPGAGLFPQPITSPCVQGSLFPFITTCAPTAFGTLNLRPNSGFAGFTGTIALNVTFPQNLPSGQTDGTFAVVSTSVGSASSGVWSACASCSLNTNGTTIHWAFVTANYNPGIIGAGTNLGAQQPIADHDGKAWGSTPSIGAYAAPATPVGVAFAALHTYFISPTGNDSNPGTNGSPWLTPNHSVVCGDAIIAAAGSYTSQFQASKWGAVSNCPSTTGGIDGTGGVNFATVLCAGALDTCTVAGGGGDGFNVTANNWAVEGFNISAPGSGRAMAAVVTGATALHHVAFINNVVTNSGYAFIAGPAGGSSSVDYIAALGNIGQNSNAYTGGSSFCGGAFDINAPRNLDTNAGTHMAIWGNYLMNNVGPSPQTDCTSDMEAINLDTLGGQSYTQQIVAKDNLIWKTGGYGFQLFYNSSAATAIPIIIDHNTTYGSCDPWISGVFNCAEINVATGDSSPWQISITNNLVRTAAATCCGTTPVYAVNYAGITTAHSGTYTVTGNFLWGTAGSICEGTCEPSSSQAIAISCCNSPALPPPTGAFTDPAYANTSDLLAHWLGAPTCSGFANVAACMGWNFGTQTATTLTPISDLTPTASGASGVGYRPPYSCAADAAYPTWLKGIAYLHWNGATLTENAGLVNKPCGY